MNKSLMDIAQAKSGPTDEAEIATDAPAEGDGAAPASGEGQGGKFKRPDISAFIPPDMKDTVDRVVAAGMKLMFSPELRQELQQAVQSQEPTSKVLSDNVVGLMLTLDQKSQGGLPQAAIFPAAMELMGEACEVMTEAGRDVTQGDYNDAALAMYAMIGQKLGGSPEDLMGAAAESMQGQNPQPDEAQPPAGAVPPQAQPAAGMPPVA